MHDYLPTPSKEISPEQIEVFVQKVRDVAPYTNEPIDNFGSYKVMYESGELDVAIHIPIMPGGIDAVEEEEAFFMSDSLSVLIRQETPTDNERYSLVHTRQYTVYLDENMTTGYDESSRVFDTQKGAWAAPRFPKDAANNIRMLQDYTATKSALGLTLFTEERFNEVCTILDDLKPEDKIS